MWDAEEKIEYIHTAKKGGEKIGRGIEKHCFQEIVSISVIVW